MPEQVWIDYSDVLLSTIAIYENLAIADTPEKILKAVSEAVREIESLNSEGGAESEGLINTAFDLQTTLVTVKQNMYSVMQYHVVPEQYKRWWLKAKEELWRTIDHIDEVLSVLKGMRHCENADEYASVRTSAFRRYEEAQLQPIERMEGDAKAIGEAWTPDDYRRWHGAEIDRLTQAVTTLSAAEAKIRKNAPAGFAL